MARQALPLTFSKRLASYFATRELLGISLILLAALLLFFSPALLTGRYFAPSDIIRIFGPFANGFPDFFGECLAESVVHW